MSYSKYVYCRFKKKTFTSAFKLLTLALDLVACKGNTFYIDKLMNVIL